ncbi:hypothetical protein LINPERPRIM_LOCUS8614 [Linum perenne]
MVAEFRLKLGDGEWINSALLYLSQNANFSIPKIMVNNPRVAGYGVDE